MQNTNTDAQAQNGRLESLDVLRGFDMFFIMGLAWFIYEFCVLCGWKDSWLALQMTHATWHGLYHHDTVFPLFLFIAGAAFPFSCAKSRSRGLSDGRIALNVLRRMAVLFLLGLAYNGLLGGTLRMGAVLSRIGVAWGLAALLYLKVGWRGRLGAVALCLVGYWMLLWFCPAPDCLSLEIPKEFAAWGNGPFSLTGNLSGWIDRHFVPGILPHNGHLCDNQSALGYIPAVATALLGLFCGEFVRTARGRLSGDRQTLAMLGWAVAELALGLLIAYGFGEASFPINKKLWSSSFVLVVAAYSTALFALFYWLIDVRRYWRRTLLFRVVGMNAITIYLVQRFVRVDATNEALFGGLWSLFPASVHQVLLSVSYMAICWLFLYFLYRRNIFLKV